MFKIGDFSRIGQVSVRMLRHYDKLNLLTPSHTDRFTGYRYYTIDQLPRLHRIVALNGIGLTLQQIAGLLGADNDLPPEQLRGMLMVRQAQLEQELSEKHAQLAEVAARLQQLEQVGKPSPYEIVAKTLDAMTVASVRTMVPHVAQMGDYCRMLYAQLYRRLAEQRIASDGLELTLYHNDQYTETDLDVETAVALDGPSPGVAELARSLPGEALAATLIYEGMYSDLTPAVLALLEWVGQQGYLPAGPLRELHRSGPAHINGRLQEPAVLELQVPIRRAEAGV